VCIGVITTLKKTNGAARVGGQTKKQAKEERNTYSTYGDKQKNVLCIPEDERVA